MIKGTAFYNLLLTVMCVLLQEFSKEKANHVLVVQWWSAFLYYLLEQFYILTLCSQSPFCNTGTMHSNLPLELRRDVFT